MRAQRAAQRFSGQYGFDARIALQAATTASAFSPGQISINIRRVVIIKGPLWSPRALFHLLNQLQ